MKEVAIHEKQEEDGALDTTITEQLQKEGDIRKLIRAVQEMRKEKGLVQSDEINLIISSRENIGDTSLLVATCKIKEIKEDENIHDNPVEVSFGVLYFAINY